MLDEELSAEQLQYTFNYIQIEHSAVAALMSGYFCKTELSLRIALITESTATAYPDASLSYVTMARPLLSIQHI